MRGVEAMVLSLRAIVRKGMRRKRSRNSLGDSIRASSPVFSLKGNLFGTELAEGT